jgi:hypothetical protein
MKTIILIIAMAILAGCASKPPVKDDRVIVVYPPEATAKSGSPINISYNGTQSNREGTDVSYHRPDGYYDSLSNGVNYKRQPVPVTNVPSNDSRTVQVPIDPTFFSESDKYYYETGYNKGRSQGR